MKTIPAWAGALTLLLAAPTTAQAHFLHHHRHLSPLERVAYFQRSLLHDQRAVARQSRVLAHHLSARQASTVRAELRWHQEALRWHRELLARARAVLVKASLPPHYHDWLCIHSHEGDWSASTGNGYYGGLQFGYDEWRRYGSGTATANLASPLEQMWAAERYWRVSGFSPWPQTARMCGLL